MQRNHYAAALSAMFGLCTLVGPVANATQTELITNGNFGAGDLSGWTVTTEPGSAGTYLTESTTTTTLSGSPTVGPASGDSFYADSDQNFITAAALTQSITVAPGSSSVVFSFDMFVNDLSGSGPSGSALDYNIPDTQFATVDLLQNGADPLSTSSADVVQNFYSGVDDNSTDVPNPYIHYSFDITNLVGSGGIYTVRFGEADNLDILNQGIDNVSVLDTSGVASTPEPSGLIGIGVGILAIAGLTLRKRKMGSIQA